MKAPAPAGIDISSYVITQPFITISSMQDLYRSGVGFVRWRYGAMESINPNTSMPIITVYQNITASFIAPPF